MISEIKGIAWIGGPSRWVPGCGTCKFYPECAHVKGVKPDTDACQWPHTVRRYEHRGMK